MQDLGDRAEDTTIDFKWDSNDAGGASITRATDGTVSVYKGNNVTQSTAGVTDTEDFDSTTGIHHCRIDTSADAFYETGEDYQVVLSAATIDGQTVNAVIASFSIQNRYHGNDLSAAAVNAEVDTALADIGLDHLVSAAVTGPDVADDSIVAQLASKSGTADWDTFDNTSDSLEAAADAVAALNDVSTGDVKGQVDQALIDIHLDHLLAATYDPGSKPGAADALFNELIEDDAGVSRYTANALEQAPSSGGTTLVVTPLAVTVSAGEVASNDLVAYEGAGGSYIFTILDDAGAAVDLSGKTVEFVAWLPGDEPSEAFAVTGSVGGDDNNQVTVTLTGTETATPRTLRYNLRNQTDDTMLAEGGLEIRQAHED